MLLVIDIGNTDLVASVFSKGKWQQNFRISSKQLLEKPETTSSFIDYVQEIASQSQEIPSIISCVVPPLLDKIAEVIQSITRRNPIILGSSVYPFLELEVLNPSEIGTDLVANAYAAWRKYEEACVVVDFGTALTFTSVSDQGSILGVAIAPGLRTAMQALFKQTAQLKEVPLELPDSVLGKGTTHAIQAGILWGYVGLVEKMLEKIQEEIGKECKSIATGGLSSVLKPLSYRFDLIDRNLTLEGLRLIAQKYDEST